MRPIPLSLLSVLLPGLLFCSKPFPDGEFLTLLLLQSALASDNNRYIFVTQGTHNGNFAAGFANGIAGADSMCASEKASNFGGLPGASGDYKAILVDGVNRNASNTANAGDGQLDWVLKPNTSYYLQDGSLIMTTNASAIVVFGTLTAAFSPDAGVRWWTGFSATAWVSSVAPCTDWSASGATNVRTGMSQATNYASLSADNTIQCNSVTTRLLCVRR
ncbi:MAG: DUF1554 domain-containing protein [Leptospirales bacterium]|nr:DUF1554 domain-containing protein [Leptospirales bacterium]